MFSLQKCCSIAAMDIAKTLWHKINAKRLNAAQDYGYDDAIPWGEVARDIGVHQSLFSRLKKGYLPSQANMAAIVEWLEAEDCVDCADAAADEAAAAADADTESDVEESGARKVRAVVVTAGKLSSSEDAETQAAVQRVSELLTEGAVGVSVALDTHPDDAEVILRAEEAAAEDNWEKPSTEYLPEGFTPRQRVRHIAVVDTGALSDARLTLDAEGNLSGPIVFEGVYTGDYRVVEVLDLEASNLPCPIIWDRHDGDHTGMTVGYVTEWEMQDAEYSFGRATLTDSAIVAALQPMVFPAAYFAPEYPAKAVPLTLSKPDKSGYRTIYGTAAPAGVCHRSSMACWTWPGDVDPAHKNFHTGFSVQLDDGNTIRLGALTLGGAHLEAALARQGVKAKDVSTHRDNANRVFAVVRAWEAPGVGLMVRGIVPPDVTHADITRALACSPSIEFWPEGRARTLVGLHLVPTPALPVLAAVGTAEFYGTDVELLEAEAETPAEETPDEETPDEETSVEGEVSAEGITGVLAGINTIQGRMYKLQEGIDAILSLIPIDHIEIPEE